jgi:hypothetical protein
MEIRTGLPLLSCTISLFPLSSGANPPEKVKVPPKLVGEKSLRRT